MSRNERIGTIIKLIANTPGITLNQLCRQLEDAGINVTERTVAKDVLLLKNDYGLLPKQERLRQGYLLENICTLAEGEVALVLDALHVFGSRLKDAEAAALIERIRRWIKGNMAVMRPTRTLRQRNIYRKGRLSKEIEEILFQAIRAQTAVSITYETPRLRKPEQVSGYPLLMVFHERGWYCIVRDFKSQTYSPRRLDRIKSCQPIKTAAPNAHHFEDLTESEFLMSCGWGMTFPRSRKDLDAANAQAPIVVRFDRTVAAYLLESVERHPLGTVSATKDGSGDAQMQIRLSNPREFLYWVRSFGSHAWVVSPPSVVEAERAEIMRMAARYK
jgi:predicted DNA-binding transcriptional regulator YafY